jgi:hypothetical protein
MMFIIIGPRMSSPQFLNLGITIKIAPIISKSFTNDMNPLVPVALKKGITSESGGGVGMGMKWKKKLNPKIKNDNPTSRAEIF